MSTSDQSDIVAVDQPASVALSPTPASEPSVSDAPADVTVVGVPLDLAMTARREHDYHRAQQLLMMATDRLRERVSHPDGGDRAVADIQNDEARQRAEIEADTNNGSRKHRRLPGWMHQMPKLVLLIDFCLLLYFFGGITDVNWLSPISVSLGFAVLLASMMTALAYGLCAFTGHHMRAHKDHSGTVYLGDLDALTKFALGASAVAAGVLATLMYIRMRTEVLYTLGPGATTTAFVVGLTLAVVEGLANLLVIAVHALDGSDQVARLNALSAAARRSIRRAHRLQRRAASWHQDSYR